MNSPEDICNTALGHLGTGYEIQNLSTDTSKEGRTMRRFYGSLRKSILGSYVWYWATVFQKLALQSIYPTPEWPFAYLYPSTCLKLVRIWNYRHTDTVEESIKYLHVNNGTQKIIVSEFGPTGILAGTPWHPTQPVLPLTGNQWPIPVAQFVADIEDVNLMPEMFKQAFAFILAGYAAPSLPGIGQVDLREKNLQLGNAALVQAVAQDQNENKLPQDLKSVIQKAGQGDGYPVRGVGYHAFNANTWPGGV